MMVAWWAGSMVATRESRTAVAKVGSKVDSKVAL